MNTAERFKEYEIRYPVERLRELHRRIDITLIRKRKSEFVRAQMCKDIIQTLDYQTGKKESIAQRRRPNRPSWIRTEQQKKILLQLATNPAVKNRINLGKDYLEVDAPSGIKKLSSSIVNIEKAQEIATQTPGIELGKNMFFAENNGHTYAYFTLDAIKEIADAGIYRIPTRKDRNEIGATLSNTKRIEPSRDGRRKTLSALMQFDKTSTLLYKIYNNDEILTKIDERHTDQTCLWSFPGNNKIDHSALCLDTSNERGYTSGVERFSAKEHAHALVLLVD